MKWVFTWCHTAAARGVFLGGLVGLLFPLAATILDLSLRNQPLTIAAALQVQIAQPLYWIIDAVPLFFAFFAALHKQMEKNLQESREQFELAVRGSNDGIWHAWINPIDYFHPRNEVYYSPRFKALLGYTGEEFANTFAAWGSLIHPDDAPRILEALRANLDQRVPYNVEFRLRTKSGEYRWFHGRAQAVWDEKGIPIRMAGSIRDITDRKRAEQERELLYQLAHDLARTSEIDAIAQPLFARIQHFLNADSGSLMLVNAEGTELHGVAAFGMGSDAFRHERLNLRADIVPATVAFQNRQPLVLLDWLEGAQLSNATREKYHFVKSAWTVPLMNGENAVGVLLVCFAAQRGADDHELRLLQMLGDEAALAIERARLTDKLRESEERYEALFDRSLDCVYVQDFSGRLLDANPSTQRLLGYPKEELLSLNFASLVAPEQIPTALQIQQEILANGSQKDVGYFTVKRKNGDVVYLETKSALIYRDGKPYATLGIARDITARKQAEEALKQAKEVAEAANQAKSDFLANMSHEIRTPMNGILGMLELTLNTSLTPEQADYVHLAKGSADILLDVINDILDFSKIEAGKFALDPVDFLLRDSLGDTVQALALRAHQKGLELLCHVRPHVPDALIGDPGRLRQVVVNLIGNAVKFTEQGEVSIEVSLDSSPQILDDSCTLHFAIRDTGIGIPADKQRLIFDPFAQADGSTTRKYGGTGLGLAISAQLVALMGGQLWVESEVGKGSTFHFTTQFDLQKATTTHSLPAESRDLHNLRVLVVDDNATNRRIFAELLTSWQMQPSLAASGTAALVALQRAASAGTPFPLVLLDVHMPEMDGFTLAAHMKQSPALAETTIVLLTSGICPNDVADCRQLGFTSYLMKPIKQSELRKTLFAAVGMAQSISQSPPLFSQPMRREYPPVEQVQRGNGGRLLLVEDNAVNQKLAIRLLEKQGYSISVASNGREALDALARAHFDAVLMDVQMPEMDGLEATVAIRAREQTTHSHIPIIAMTAHAMKGDRERCLAAGMDDYVSKPLKPTQLFTAIERWVSTSAPTAVATPAGPDAAVVPHHVSADLPI